MNILPTLLQENTFTLLPMKENPRSSTRPWYKENEFCEYHRQRGHNTSGCMQLKHEIQDLINNGLVSTGSPVAPPNQNLGVFNNPFPSHDVNQVGVYLIMDQGYHNVDLTSFYDYIV